MTVFVDTNVFVYARDASEPEKQPQAAAWLDELWRSRTGRLSLQVLHELYVTLTRKLDPGLTPAEARDEVNDLMAWSPLVHDVSLLRGAWQLEDEHSLSFWDALIVAAADASGCSHLLTEDLQDGQLFGSVTVVDPFRHRPTAMLAS